MTTIVFYLGDKGDDGKDGVNGLGSADVNGYDIEQPILDSFVDNKLSKNAYIEHTKNDSSSYTDRYGRNTWNVKPESTNYVPYSVDFSQWTDLSNRWEIIGSTPDPFGGNDATEINLTADTDNLPGVGEVMEINTTTPAINGCISFYIKLISGDISGLQIGVGSQSLDVEDITSEYKRIIFPRYFAASTFIFSINPRGKSGARFAIYAAQIEDNPTAQNIIKTEGIQNTDPFDGGNLRQSEKGILIEESKKNYIHYSNDISKWTLENCTVEQYPGADAFGHYYQFIKPVFGSLPNISITSNCDSLTQGVTYTVSFWAFVASGSLQPIIVSLGGGPDVVFDNPSVAGFTRLSAECVAGGLDQLEIKLESQALTASVLISSVQVETAEITSYKQTGAVGVTVQQDDFLMQYTYNFPSPATPWSLIFGKGDMIDSDSEKFILSNGETGANQFSVSYKNRLLTVTMGLNSVSEELFDYERVAIVFTGSQIKFFGEQTFISTKAIAPLSFISNQVYIGYNGSSNFVNAYLKDLMSYNTELTTNEVVYLLGV